MNLVVIGIGIVVIMVIMNYYYFNVKQVDKFAPIDYPIQMPADDMIMRSYQVLRPINNRALDDTIVTTVPIY